MASALSGSCSVRSFDLALEMEMEMEIFWVVVMLVEKGRREDAILGVG